MTALVAVPYGHGFDEMLCEAFAGVGWQAGSVLYFHRGSRPGVTNLWSRGRALLRGEARTFEDEKRRCLAATYRRVAADQPDLLLAVRGEWLDAEAMGRIRALRPGIRIVVWIYDPIDLYHQGLDASAMADLVYLYDLHDMERWAVRTGRTPQRLDLAHSASRLAPLDVEPDVDVSMTGSFGFGSYGRRIEVAAALARIAERHALRVQLVGALWTNWSPAAAAGRRELARRFPELARVFVNRRLSYPEQNALYNRSCINVNVHRDESAGSSNTRVFEILGAGGFQLCDHNPVVLQHFRPGEHLDVFGSDAELEERVLYYLAHDAERRQIARAGHQRARQYHQFQHRVQRVLDDLAAQPAVPA